MVTSTEPGLNLGWKEVEEIVEVVVEVVNGMRKMEVEGWWG